MPLKHLYNFLSSSQAMTDQMAEVYSKSLVPVYVRQILFHVFRISHTSVKFQSPLLLTQETGSVHDETSSSGNKEDEDDDEDEGEDKIDPQQYDPERLKAFNVSNTGMYNLPSGMGM
jgi:hypothetical protein